VVSAIPVLMDPAPGPDDEDLSEGSVDDMVTAGVPYERALKRGAGTRLPL
jgi:hypothetical protein